MSHSVLSGTFTVLEARVQDQKYNMTKTKTEAEAGLRPVLS